ncbi:polysaccharide deacetylase family protein [Butyrivibrio sp. VCB2006]|uniref:polysaccharide deacetylase family protein n=1 Tax=Butyrivibrio sp. VCB2006 TaxID=1280679 RepID=UPI0004216230|nr:polysaccharide deacetylase family protein [Butyrivibrio sp. VCB2006]
MLSNDVIEYVKGHDVVYCYGAGRFGKIARVFLSENGCPIDGFVVSKIENGQRECLELPIYEISEAAENIKSGAGIIICVNQTLVDIFVNHLKEIEAKDYLIVDENVIAQMDQMNSYDKVFHQKGRTRTLLYHRIQKLEKDIWGIACSPQSFELQMKILKEHFEVVPIDDIIVCTDKDRIIISFDDGYKDNYENALPILEKYNIPAVIYVSTGNIGSDKEFWWDEIERIICSNEKCPDNILFMGDEYALTDMGLKVGACYKIRENLLRMLPEERDEQLSILREITLDDGAGRMDNKSISANELKMLDKAAVITIGGHTVSHSRLSAEPEEMQRWEIEESKHVIENYIGHVITTFSFPFGGIEDYDEKTISVAREAGYEIIAAVTRKYYDPKMDEYNFGRICVQNIESARDFKRFLSLN